MPCVPWNTRLQANTRLVSIHKDGQLHVTLGRETASVLCRHAREACKALPPFSPCPVKGEKNWSVPLPTQLLECASPAARAGALSLLLYALMSESVCVSSLLAPGSSHLPPPPCHPPFLPLSVLRSLPHSLPLSLPPSLPPSLSLALSRSLSVSVCSLFSCCFIAGIGYAGRFAAT